MLMYSCNKDVNSDKQPESMTTIFGVGSFAATPSSKAVACYWENGKLTNLTNGNFDAVANSMVVTENGDKHVVGSEKTTYGNMVAKYWKNGTVTWLPAAILGDNSVANDIAVNGTDVYIAGTENAGNGNSVAVYWKNNNKEYLSNQNTNSYATAIAFANNKTYVPGYEKNGLIATSYIWINGVATALSPGNHNSVATDVFVNNTKIYVAGYEVITGKTVALYWVCDNVNGLNFTIHYLSNTQNFALASTITAIGNDVYTGGSEALSGKYWKNTNAADICILTTTDDGHVNALFAFGTDIYALSSQDAGGYKCWKNAVFQTTISSEKGSRINNLFVINK